MNILPSNEIIRICIDPWDVNKVLKQANYAIITEALRFTFPDVCSGYMQLQVDDQSSKLYNV